MVDTRFSLALLLTFTLTVNSIPFISKDNVDNLKTVSVTVDKKTGVYEFHEGHYTGVYVAHAEFSDTRKKYG